MSKPSAKKSETDFGIFSVVEDSSVTSKPISRHGLNYGAPS